MKYFVIIKAINTGLQGLENQETTKMSSFDVYNNEIGILLDQFEAEKINNILFEYNFTIKLQKMTIIIMVIFLMIFLMISPTWAMGHVH